MVMFDDLGRFLNGMYDLLVEVVFQAKIVTFCFDGLIGEIKITITGEKDVYKRQQFPLRGLPEAEKVFRDLP